MITIVPASLCRIFLSFPQPTPTPHCTPKSWPFSPWLSPRCFRACKWFTRWLNRKHYSMPSDIFEIIRGQSYSNSESVSMAGCWRFIVCVLEAAKKGSGGKFWTRIKESWRGRQSRIVSQKMNRSMGRKVLVLKRAREQCRDSDPSFTIHFTSNKGPHGAPAARFAWGPTETISILCQSAFGKGARMTLPALFMAVYVEKKNCRRIR